MCALPLSPHAIPPPDGVTEQLIRPSGGLSSVRSGATAPVPRGCRQKSEATPEDSDGGLPPDYESPPGSSLPLALTALPADPAPSGRAAPQRPPPPAEMPLHRQASLRPYPASSPTVPPEKRSTRQRRESPIDPTQFAPPKPLDGCREGSSNRARYPPRRAVRTGGSPHRFSPSPADPSPGCSNHRRASHQRWGTGFGTAARNPPDRPPTRRTPS